MFTVRRQRAFVAQGVAWTIWVECEGPKLDASHQLEGVDWREFWRWLSHHITQFTDEGAPIPVPDGTVQGLGQLLDTEPEAWPAERLAGVLLLELRKLSSAVVAVTVQRNVLALYNDGLTECTVRTNEAAPITQAGLVEVLRRIAQLNPGWKIHQSM